MITAIVATYALAAIAANLSNCRYLISFKVAGTCIYHNDRDQKVAFISNYNGSPYDAVLVGTSTAAAIDTSQFAQRTLNLGLLAARRSDQAEILRAYVEHHGSPRTVYLMIDFPFAIQSDANDPSRFEWRGPLEQLMEIAAPETIQLALRSIAYRATGPRQNVCLMLPDLSRDCGCGPREERLRRADSFNPSPPEQTSLNHLDRELAAIAAASPESQFRVVVAPIHATALSRYLEKVRADDYRAFFEILISRFREVHSFLMSDELTIDGGNWQDWLHLCADSTQRFVQALEQSAPPPGAIVNTATLDEHLRAMGTLK